MLKSTRLDRLIQEQNQYKSILTNLTNSGAHKETGVMFDRKVIQRHIHRLSEEIAELESELS